MFLLELNSCMDGDSKDTSTATSGWTINLFPQSSVTPPVVGSACTQTADGLRSHPVLLKCIAHFSFFTFAQNGSEFLKGLIYIFFVFFSEALLPSQIHKIQKAHQLYSVLLLYNARLRYNTKSHQQLQRNQIKGKEKRDIGKKLQINGSSFLNPVPDGNDTMMK